MRVPYVQLARQHWDRVAEEYHHDHPEHENRLLHPSWGLAHHPESELRLLTPPYDGKVLLDLGCGQGHDARGYAGLGMQVVGVDISSAQLRLARSGPRTAYVRASATRLPVRAESVDVVVSDHGAFDHAPLQPLISEAYRVLRPGGQLVVCTYHPIAFISYDEGSGVLGKMMRRAHPTRGSATFAGESFGFFAGAESWVSALVRSGFTITRVVESMSSQSSEYYSDLVPRAWADKWPVDWIWSAVKHIELPEAGR
jgi:ubiquinone/menaquinone biosynthesis C-methylase UbiE